ncbi:putative Desacetoxyvindoline 4-hydroxylase [Corchorus olitorius]|uniref:Desacetoxyvindoline 4-hydroxylase n=1 Tax=Corchorus olitorius TaxID=93759 RepID=A0A1R3GCQ5_9ROSI|nr:putative Desacetoxyvindoline 4-hydroxylase [Corchorus olitorius]
MKIKTLPLTLLDALNPNLALFLRDEAHNSLDLAFTGPKIHLPISESSRPIGLIFGEPPVFREESVWFFGTNSQEEKSIGVKFFGVSSVYCLMPLGSRNVGS